jgi:hypothetical protein
VKEFNLKDALAGKPVITRDGRPVEIAGYNKERNRLAGWIYGEVNQWTGGGKSITYTTCDLLMAPNERKEWVVRVERNNGNKFVSGPFITENEYKLFIEHLSPGCTYTIHQITIHE